MDMPSQKLAARIIERLVSEKLLDASAGKKLLPKLALGKLTAQDWRLPIETSDKNEAGK
jgi:hypothetical protein